MNMFKYLNKLFNNNSNKVSTLKVPNANLVVDNFLEPDVRRVLSPLYIAQYLTIAPKYSIRCNYVTSNSFNVNLTIILISIIILIAYSFIFMDYITKEVIILNYNYLFITNICLYISSLVVAYILNTAFTVFRSEYYSLLIIKVQKIHKCFVHIKCDVSKVLCVSWISVLGVIMYDVIYFSIRFFMFNDSLSFTVLTQLFTLSTDCTIVIATRIINLLTKLLITWVSELEHITKNMTETNLTEDHIRDDTQIQLIAEAYDELMDTLNICEKIFEVPITCFVFTAFFQVFVKIQFIIEWPAWNATFLSIIALVIKSLTLLTLFSMECENMQLSLKNAQVSCLISLNGENIADAAHALRQKAGHTMRMKEEPLVTACGLFPVDATLPLRLLAVLATYTVVLLQFYFL